MNTHTDTRVCIDIQKMPGARGEVRNYTGITFDIMHGIMEHNYGSFSKQIVRKR